MDFIKNNWVLLLILIIAIYLVYNYYQKSKAKEVINEANVLAKEATKNVTSNTGPVIQVTPSQTITVNTNSSSWKIGDKLYAGKTGVNSYSAPSSSASGIVKFYNSDSYIGTFLAIENGYAKIIIQAPTNSLLEAFGYNSNQIVYSLANQIYKK